MQVTETLKDGLKRAYTITVTAAELEAKVTEKLVEAQPDVEIKGFRKGKVPLAILRKQFGQRLLGDAMQDAIDGAMKDHFDKSGDRPAMQPDVKMVGGETWKEGMDVVVEMTYEALPPIPDVDASSITLERLVVKASDADVEEALKNLASTAQSFEDRKKGAKAKDGDQVTIDFKGSVDGELFEGGSAEDYPLVLGSKSFIPGFEDQLVGAKVGEERTLNVTFPDDYPAENLKGQPATFDVKVTAVKTAGETAIDDDFAKTLGLQSLDQLKGLLRDRRSSTASPAPT